jgi:uncharacterized protein YcbK (DUF882 family)
LSRRALLGWAACAAAAWTLPRAVRATEREREIAFVHTHTGESARVTYWADGDYLPEGLGALKRLLRDHYSGEEHAIEPRLLDLLQRLHQSLGAREPFHVISGYRSPATNAALAARSGGVATRSLHLLGQAIDVRLPGCELTTLRDAALALRAGGVGYYGGPSFVHVDVGRVRRW